MCLIIHDYMDNLKNNLEEESELVFKKRVIGHILADQSIKVCRLLVSYVRKCICRILSFKAHSPDYL